MRITLSFVSWKRDTKTTILSLWARISLNHDPSIVRDEAHDFEPLDTKLKLSSSLLLFRRFLLSINTEPKKTTKTKSLVEIREEIKKRKRVLIDQVSTLRCGSGEESRGDSGFNRRRKRKHFCRFEQKETKRFCVRVAGRFKILEFFTFCLVSVTAILVLCFSLSLFLCFFFNLILKMFFLKFNPN